MGLVETLEIVIRGFWNLLKRRLSSLQRFKGDFGVGQRVQHGFSGCNGKNRGLRCFGGITQNFCFQPDLR
jgi:hypothetical protein